MDTTYPTDHISELLTGTRKSLTIAEMIADCSQLYRTAYRDNGPRHHVTVHLGLALACLREAADSPYHADHSGTVPAALRGRIDDAAAHLARVYVPENQYTAPALSQPQPWINHTRIGQLLGSDEPAPPTERLIHLCHHRKRAAEDDGHPDAASEYSEAWTTLHRVDRLERNPDLLKPRGDLDSNTPAHLLREARVHLVQAVALLDTDYQTLL